MARAMPTLGDAFEEYMAVNPNRSKRTNELYRYEANRYLGDWLTRPLDGISRRDVETRFNGITADHGWSAANRAMSLLRSVYRRPCVDHDGLRNPGDLWLAGGGKSHRKTRRKISTPGGGAAVLARRYRDGGAQPDDPGRRLVRALHRHAPRGGADPALGAGRHGSAHVPGRGNEDRRALGASDHPPARGHSPTPPGRGRRLPTRRTRLGVPLADQRHRPWFRTRITSMAASARPAAPSSGSTALRNCFITVAERELMLPPSLTKRLVNHARPNDVTEGYAADWTVAQPSRAGAENRRSDRGVDARARDALVDVGSTRTATTRCFAETAAGWHLGLPSLQALHAGGGVLRHRARRRNLEGFRGRSRRAVNPGISVKARFARLSFGREN